MTRLWEGYEEWVVQGGDKKIKMMGTMAQLMLGYNGRVIDNVWRNEGITSVMSLVEYINSLICQRHQSNEPVNPAVVLVEVLRLSQRAAEMALRIRIIGSLHWPWETPRRVKILILAIEALKAAFLTIANKYLLADLKRVFTSYLRRTSRGRRSGMTLPTMGEVGVSHAPVTLLDLFAVTTDLACIFRPVLYAAALLFYHNKAKPWRPLLISFAIEVYIFVVTLAKEHRKSSLLNRPSRMAMSEKQLTAEITSSRKVSRQVSRFTDYLLRDPLYSDYVKPRIAFVTDTLERLPLFGFFMESWQLLRPLHFTTSGS
eukprot:TRINITY_DN10630_c0_g1_i1.p1 TRINITY_DN10630_c0_g1~~TRINITY_DN10630_c0_g1_i1.p1  ORF type:complete len:315 (+),score=40.91 TRINITY_DN10630_c0_g1_i1:47-991(+)